jgi:hypothetical protein
LPFTQPWNFQWLQCGTYVTEYIRPKTGIRSNVQKRTVKRGDACDKGMFGCAANAVQVGLDLSVRWEFRQMNNSAAFKMPCQKNDSGCPVLSVLDNIRITGRNVYYYLGLTTIAYADRLHP